MNIAAIQFPVFKPYKKATFEIYISGCTRNCNGCHNPELHDFNTGEKLNLQSLIVKLNKMKNLFEIISITGGDLLCQPEKQALFLAHNIRKKYKDKEIWLFTGADKETCPEWVWENFDVVKTGKYDKNTANENNFPVSSNQKVLRKGKDFK